MRGKESYPFSFEEFPLFSLPPSTCCPQHNKHKFMSLTPSECRQAHSEYLTTSNVLAISAKGKCDRFVRLAPASILHALASLTGLDAWPGYLNTHKQPANIGVEHVTRSLPALDSVLNAEAPHSFSRSSLFHETIHHLQSAHGHLLVPLRIALSPSHGKSALQFAARYTLGGGGNGAHCEPDSDSHDECEKDHLIFGRIDPVSSCFITSCARNRFSYWDSFVVFANSEGVPWGDLYGGPPPTSKGSADFSFVHAACLVKSYVVEKANCVDATCNQWLECNIAATCSAAMSLLISAFNNRQEDSHPCGEVLWYVVFWIFEGLRRISNSPSNTKMLWDEFFAKASETMSSVEAYGSSLLIKVTLIFGWTIRFDASVDNVLPSLSVCVAERLSSSDEALYTFAAAIFFGNSFEPIPVELLLTLLNVAQSAPTKSRTRFLVRILSKIVSKLENCEQQGEQLSPSVHFGSASRALIVFFQHITGHIDTIPLSAIVNAKGKKWHKMIIRGDALEEENFGVGSDSALHEYLNNRINEYIVNCECTGTAIAENDQDDLLQRLWTKLAIHGRERLLIGSLFQLVVDRSSTLEDKSFSIGTVAAFCMSKVRETEDLDRRWALALDLGECVSEFVSRTASDPPGKSAVMSSTWYCELVDSFLPELAAGMQELLIPDATISLVARTEVELCKSVVVDTCLVPVNLGGFLTSTVAVYRGTSNGEPQRGCLFRVHGLRDSEVQSEDSKRIPVLHLHSPSDVCLRLTIDPEDNSNNDEAVVTVSTARSFNPAPNYVSSTLFSDALSIAKFFWNLKMWGEQSAVRTLGPCLNITVATAVIATLTDSFILVEFASSLNLHQFPTALLLFLKQKLPDASNLYSSIGNLLSSRWVHEHANQSWSSSTVLKRSLMEMPPMRPLQLLHQTINLDSQHIQRYSFKPINLFQQEQSNPLRMFVHRGNEEFDSESLCHSGEYPKAGPSPGVFYFEVTLVAKGSRVPASGETNLGVDIVLGFSFCPIAEEDKSKFSQLRHDRSPGINVAKPPPRGARAFLKLPHDSFVVGDVVGVGFCARYNKFFTTKNGKWTSEKSLSGRSRKWIAPFISSDGQAKFEYCDTACGWLLFDLTNYLQRLGIRFDHRGRWNNEAARRTERMLESLCESSLVQRTMFSEIDLAVAGGSQEQVNSLVVPLFAFRSFPPALHLWTLLERMPSWILRGCGPFLAIGSLWVDWVATLIASLLTDRSVTPPEFFRLCCEFLGFLLPIAADLVQVASAAHRHSLIVQVRQLFAYLHNLELHAYNDFLESQIQCVVRKYLAAFRSEAEEVFCNIQSCDSLEEILRLFLKPTCACIGENIRVVFPTNSFSSPKVVLGRWQLFSFASCVDRGDSHAAESWLVIEGDPGTLMLVPESLVELSQDFLIDTTRLTPLFIENIASELRRLLHQESVLYSNWRQAAMQADSAFEGGDYVLDERDLILDEADIDSLDESIDLHDGGGTSVGTSSASADRKMLSEVGEDSYGVSRRKQHEACVESMETIRKMLTVFEFLCLELDKTVETLGSNPSGLSVLQSLREMCLRFWGGKEPRRIHWHRPRHGTRGWSDRRSVAFLSLRHLRGRIPPTVWQLIPKIAGEAEFPHPDGVTLKAEHLGNGPAECCKCRGSLVPSDLCFRVLRTKGKKCRKVRFYCVGCTSTIPPFDDRGIPAGDWTTAQYFGCRGCQEIKNVVRGKLCSSCVAFYTDWFFPHGSEPLCDGIISISKAQVLLRHFSSLPKPSKKSKNVANSDALDLFHSDLDDEAISSEISADSLEEETSRHLCFPAFTSNIDHRFRCLSALLNTKSYFHAAQNVLVNAVDELFVKFTLLIAKAAHLILDDLPNEGKLGVAMVNIACDCQWAASDCLSQPCSSLLIFLLRSHSRATVETTLASLRARWLFPGADVFAQFVTAGNLSRFVFAPSNTAHFACFPIVTSKQFECWVIDKTMKSRALKPYEAACFAEEIDENSCVGFAVSAQNSFVVTFGNEGATQNWFSEAVVEAFKYSCDNLRRHHGDRKFEIDIRFSNATSSMLDEISAFGDSVASNPFELLTERINEFLAPLSASELISHPGMSFVRKYYWSTLYKSSDSDLLPRKSGQLFLKIAEEPSRVTFLEPIDFTVVDPLCAELFFIEAGVPIVCRSNKRYEVEAEGAQWTIALKERMDEPTTVVSTFCSLANSLLMSVRFQFWQGDPYFAVGFESDDLSVLWKPKLSKVEILGKDPVSAPLVLRRNELNTVTVSISSNEFCISNERTRVVIPLQESQTATWRFKMLFSSPQVEHFVDLSKFEPSHGQNSIFRLFLNRLESYAERQLTVIGLREASKPVETFWLAEPSESQLPVISALCQTVLPYCLRSNLLCVRKACSYFSTQVPAGAVHRAILRSLEAKIFTDVEATIGVNRIALSTTIAEQLGAAFRWDKGIFFKSLRVNFLGEGGQDEGGPFQEMICCLGKELQTKSGLFSPTPNNVFGVGKEQDCVWLSDSNHRSVFEMIGSLVARQSCRGERFDFRVPSLFWPCLFTRAQKFSKDLFSTFDWHVGNSVEQIRSNPSLFEDLEEDCSTQVASVQNRCRDQMEWFLRGAERAFRGHFLLVPTAFLRDLCARREIDIEVLISCCEFRGDQKDVDNLLGALRSFSKDELVAVVRFWTGRESIGDQQLHVEIDLEEGTLPTSRTCFLQLHAPTAGTSQLYSRLLLFAAENCTTVDGDFDAHTFL